MRHTTDPYNPYEKAKAHLKYRSKGLSNCPECGGSLTYKALTRKELVKK